MLDGREERDATADDAEDEDVAWSDEGPPESQGVLDLDCIVSVRHMLRHYLIVIAPMERDCAAWRSLTTWRERLGNEREAKKKSNSLCQKVNRGYLPCLIALLRVRDDEHVDIWKAAQLLETRRGHWTDFAALMKQQNNALELGRFRAYIAELNSKAFGDRTLASA